MLNPGPGARRSRGSRLFSCGFITVQVSGRLCEAKPEAKRPGNIYHTASRAYFITYYVVLMQKTKFEKIAKTKGGTLGKSKIFDFFFHIGKHFCEV